jgi:hypothetical protein
MVAGSFVAAACRGLRRRVGRGYGYYLSYYFLSIDCVRAFFHRYGSHVAMQCDGGWDGKLQLDGEVDGEQRVDQWQRIADRAKFAGNGDGDRDQHRGYEQVGNGDGDGGNGVNFACDYFCGGGV